MGLTKIDSFPFGQGKYLPVDYTGPASYATAGDTIGAINNMTGITALGLSTIDNVEGSSAFSVSGAYQIFTKPTGVGSRKTWTILWNGNGGVSGVVQLAAGTGMTPGVYTSTAATGGAGTNPVVAQIQVTVLTATTIGPIVVLNPGRGYTTLPTGFTVATGGTPPTFTVSGAVLGPVTAATNLSGETVRIAIIGR